MRRPWGAPAAGTACLGQGVLLALLVGVSLAGCGGTTPAATVVGRSPTVRSESPPGVDASPSKEATPATMGPDAATATSTAPPATPSIAQPTAAQPKPVTGPTTTATLPAPDAPQHSIAAGQWSFDYRLTSNSCQTPPLTTTLAVTQQLEEVSAKDGYIADGELVRVYDFNGGASLGVLTFHWPTLSYQAPLNEPGGVRTEVRHTFTDARTGSSIVVEVYKEGTGTCELTYTQ